MADSKRKKAAREKIDSAKAYLIEDALNLVKELATSKFPESVDVAVNLGVDPRKSDQVVRGSTVLPNGTGKSIRVAVFAQGEHADKATAAGADGRRQAGTHRDTVVLAAVLSRRNCTRRTTCTCAADRQAATGLRPPVPILTSVQTAQARDYRQSAAASARVLKAASR